MLYEVVLNLQYLNQKFVNRWNYISDSTEGDGNLGAFGLIRALGFYADGSPAVFPTGSLGAAIQALLNEQTIFVQAYAKNVYVPTDFYDYAFVDNVVGGVAGQGMSPVNAIGFTSSRTRTDIRRGQKRFGGVPVGFVTNGGDISATGLTAAATVADKLGDIVTYDTGASIIAYNGAVVSKQKLVDEDGNVTYQYYSTLAQQEEHLMTSLEWDVKPNIRTQGSRQYGRGA